MDGAFQASTTIAAARSERQDSPNLARGANWRLRWLRQALPRPTRGDGAASGAGRGLRWSGGGAPRSRARGSACGACSGPRPGGQA
eukprot:7148932-Prymnesium_polylepis.1